MWRREQGRGVLKLTLCIVCLIGRVSLMKKWTRLGCVETDLVYGCLMGRVSLVKEWTRLCCVETDLVYCMSDGES